jgi:glycerol-3-phosphate acyltransferase PlsY
MINWDTTTVALLVLGYLLGSVSSAIIVCRLMGLPDPRTSGSKNPGATNVLRVGNKIAAAITLFGDMVKGVVPVAVGWLFTQDVRVLILIGFAAFIGHLYPLFFGFRGGKGVATAIGALLASYWAVGLCTVGTWLFVAKVMRISSLSALIAFLLAPLYAWLLKPDPFYVGIVATMSVLLFWRHRKNIHNLIAGTEK